MQNIAMSQLFIALLVIIRIQSISLGCRCHAAQIHVCVVGKWIALRPYCYLYPASPSLRTLSKDSQYRQIWIKLFQIRTITCESVLPYL